MGLTPVSTKSGLLAPGFRFHPTDEELVSYYLKHKVCGKPFRFEAISDIEVYKSEPWDLQSKSRLKTRDLEWYFFSSLDKKYGNGSRTNRATERGYWKTTGKDRGIFHSSRMVGMKKTLVYYTGRAPRGERTNWVMHEYRIVDETLQKSGIFLDAFVLCRIFMKSGLGPKNGEQYGAPFVEEEWDDDELVMAPGEDARREEAVGDDAYKDGKDIGQVCDRFHYTLEIIGGPNVTSGDVSLPFGFYYGDNSTNVPVPLDFVDDSLKLGSFIGEGYFAPDQPVNYVYPDYLLDDPFFDASNMPVDEGEYLQTNDLSNTFVVDPSYLDMVEEYLPSLDADNGNLQFMDFDSPNMMGSENIIFDHSCLAQKHLLGEAQQENMENEQVSHGLHNDVSSLPSDDLRKLISDIQPRIVQRANRILGSIPAPPAFALEFPTKDAAFLLHSARHSSSQAHITASMVQRSNMTMSGNRANWSFEKNADVNIFPSFGLSPNDPNFPKVVSAGQWCLFYLLFVKVLILSICCRIGTYFHTSKAT